MAREPNFDAYITKLPPEPKAVCRCACCDEEMYAGDEAVLTWNDEVIHEQCLDDYVQEYVVFIRGYLSEDGNVE